MVEHGTGALSVVSPLLPLAERLLPQPQRQALQTMEKATNLPATGLGFLLGLVTPVTELGAGITKSLGAPKPVTTALKTPGEFYTGLNIGLAESGLDTKAPSGPLGTVWKTLTGSEYITPASIGALDSFVLPIAGLKAPKLAEVVTKIDPAMLAMTGVGRGLD